MEFWFESKFTIWSAFLKVFFFKFSKDLYSFRGLSVRLILDGNVLIATFSTIL